MASSLDVSPKELRFRADTKKQPPAVLYLTNSTSERVAFKVKTTAPKRYCVKPSADVVEPNATVEVKVFMQSKELGNTVTAGECKDKFLIQSSPVASDWSMKNDTSSNGTGDVFSKSSNPKLVEEKLKVFLESPPAPPSPVPEASETTEFANASPTAGATQRAVPGGAIPSSTVQYASKQSGSQSQSQLEAENRDLREKLALMKVHQGESSAAAKSGFRLIHMLPVAILAFLLGYFL